MDWTSYNEIRAQVSEYYNKHRQYFLTLTAVRCVVTVMLLLVSFYYYVTSPSIIYAVLFGLINTYLAYIGHETTHFAFGKNYFGFHLLTYAGHDANQWFTLHNCEHHNFTNFSTIDSDIDQSPVLRHVPSEPWKPQHAYQHIYAYFVYSLAAFRYIFVPFSFERKAHLFVMQVLIPLFFMSPLEVFVHFIVFAVTTSYYLALVNVINHTNDLVEFDPRTKDGKLSNDFFEHQIRTTLNYGSESFIQNLLTSGLNNQIEHHLFPTIPSIAYPYIAPMIREFAHKKGLKYVEVNNFFDGLASHHRHLKRMGVNDKKQD